MTRSLGGPARTSADVWRISKPFVRQIQRTAGVLILDDSIAHKPYSDENEIVCWHYDHSTGQMAKGINFLTSLYYCQSVALPVGFVLIAKTEQYVDKKDGKSKRRSPTSKNEYYRRLAQQAVDNQIPFQYVLNDVWYASAENMRFVKQELHKDFVMPVKTNRKVALSVAEQQQRQFVRVDTLSLEPNRTYTVYLEDVDFPLLLVKQLFANEDGSQGILYLVTSETTLTYDQLTTLYRTRWPVEPYHKSLKQNASLEKSPTHTVATQTNHFGAALCSYIKLELLKVNLKTNHFALKTKLYTQAVQAAFKALRELQPVSLPA